MSCVDKLQNGGSCRYSAKAEYGGRYCGVHKAGWFREQKETKDAEISILGDQIKSLTARLTDATAKDGNKEVAKIAELLKNAVIEVTKKNRELVDIVKAEAEATREVVREEAADTRVLVDEKTRAIAMMLLAIDNKVDGIAGRPAPAQLPRQNVPLVEDRSNEFANTILARISNAPIAALRDPTQLRDHLEGMLHADGDYLANHLVSGHPDTKKNARLFVHRVLDNIKNRLGDVSPVKAVLDEYAGRYPVAETVDGCGDVRHHKRLRNEVTVQV